jgi:uncharacterized iron-regulated membrane protein
LAFHWRLWTRRWHRWAAVLVAIPFLVVILTGILLQLKKELTWVQPPTKKGSGKTPTVSFDAILSAARAAHPPIRGWEDVERLDVQPNRGMVKVQVKDHWEVQVDLQTGDALQTAYRRSDFIESMHDGSWFHDNVKLWVFLPAAFLVLGLWITGMYLWILPILARREKRRAKLGDATK